jgi:hypothetical protein
MKTQEYLDKNYPKESRKELTELNIGGKSLEGELEEATDLPI